MLLRFFLKAVRPANKPAVHFSHVRTRSSQSGLYMTLDPSRFDRAQVKMMCLLQIDVVCMTIGDDKTACRPAERGLVLYLAWH